VPAVGDHPWRLRAIRERVKQGATDALAKGPGRPRRDPERAALERDLELTSKALKELASENTLLREESMRLDRSHHRTPSPGAAQAPHHRRAGL